MSLLLVLQVPVIEFVIGMTWVKPSLPTDGVTEFHVSFLSLDSSQNDLCLTAFLTEGKRVFHVLIFSLERLGNGFVSGRLSYKQASTYRPRPTYYVTVLVFVCLYERTTLASIFSSENISHPSIMPYIWGTCESFIWKFHVTLFVAYI